MPFPRQMKAAGDTPVDKLTCIASGAITENDIVIGNGISSNMMQVVRADADTVALARGSLWIALGSAADGQPVDVARWRLVRNVNTSAWGTAGDPVYMSGTPGGVAAVEGVQGVQVGEVLVVNATTGSYILAPNGSYGGSLHVVRRRLVTIPGGNGAGSVGQLFAAPVTLVAAQGADTFIEFVSAHLFHDFATAGYDGVAAGEDLVISYTNAAGRELARIETTGFLDQASDQHRLVYFQPPAVNGTVGDITPVANSPLVIHTLVGSVFGAAGDTPLLVEVFYRVRDLTPA